MISRPIKKIYLIRTLGLLLIQGWAAPVCVFTTLRGFVNLLLRTDVSLDDAHRNLWTNKFELCTLR